MNNVQQLSPQDLNDINGGEWPWTLIYNASYNLGHNISELIFGTSTGGGGDTCTEDDDC